jgi:rare lipoprotein A (peptidoglycan hydrolase)
MTEQTGALEQRESPDIVSRCHGQRYTFGPFAYWHVGNDQSKPNERKYVLRNQNTMYRRSIKAAAVTAALACVLATGAEIRSSSAAQLTYFHRNGKLHLVNTDRNGGLQGIASVYHDRITANGEHMNPNAMTAAHKSLPMGSRVTVFNKRNGRSVTVRINDRGPYVTGRVIDLSPGAARVLRVDGLAQVSLQVNRRSS